LGPPPSRQARGKEDTQKHKTAADAPIPFSQQPSISSAAAMTPSSTSRFTSLQQETIPETPVHRKRSAKGLEEAEEGERKERKKNSSSSSTTTTNEPSTKR